MIGAGAKDWLHRRTRTPWRPSRATYRGNDRRVHQAVESPFGRPFVLASMTIASVAAAWIVVALRHATPPALDVRAVDAVLWVACAVLALVTSFISCLRWRMAGDTTSLRVGAAMLVIATLAVVMEVLPFVARDVHVGTALQRLDAAMTIVLVVLLYIAVVARPIDTVASPRRLAASMAIGTVALVLLQFVTSLRTFRHAGVRPESAAGVVVAIGTVLAVLLLACIAIARGAKHRSWLWAWLGLGLVAFAMARVVGMAAEEAHDAWTTGTVALGICGLLCILYGVAQELKLAFVEQREQLFDSQIEVEVHDARDRAERHRREERVHQARSAMLAIRSALAALTTTYDDVAGPDRAALRDAILTEIELLRDLLVDGPTRPSSEFEVADSVLPVVVCHHARGLEIDARVPAGLRAIGDPAELAEVVQGVLDNARDHAPGSPVTVRATRQGVRSWCASPTTVPGSPSRSASACSRAVPRAVRSTAAWASTWRGGCSAPAAADSASRAVPTAARRSSSPCRRPHVCGPCPSARTRCTTSTTSWGLSIRTRWRCCPVVSDAVSPRASRSGSRNTASAVTRAGGTPVVTTTSKRRLAGIAPSSAGIRTTSIVSSTKLRARRSPSRWGRTAISTRWPGRRTAMQSVHPTRARPSSAALLNRGSSILGMSGRSVHVNLSGSPAEEAEVVALLDSHAAVSELSVLIVEDHALLADALVEALGRAGMRAASISGPTADAIVDTARAVSPDLVLLDLVLGDDIGLSVPLVGRLRETGAQVVMLTGSVDAALIGSCVEAGAVGVVSKNENFDVVLEKVQRALRHESTLAAFEREEMLASLRRCRAEEQRRLAPFDRLTARERAVLVALMDGSTAEEIARSCFVSLATVRSQIRSVLEKLGVHSQVAAVALAHRAHWEAC